MRKRGQALSTNAIILIVLGIIILVVLILGFTMGWDKLAPWLSTNNVDTIKTQCQVACSTGGRFDFCSVDRTVNDGINKKFEATCGELASNEMYADRGYGIEECVGMVPCPDNEAEE